MNSSMPHQRSLRAGFFCGLFFAALVVTPGARAAAPFTVNYHLPATPANTVDGFFSADTPPVLRIKSGEVVEIRSEEHTSELQSHSDLHSFPYTTLFRSRQLSPAGDAGQHGRRIFLRRHPAGVAHQVGRGGRD